MVVRSNPKITDEPSIRVSSILKRVFQNILIHLWFKIGLIYAYIVIGI
jgi:hypothetical protein